MGSVNLRGTPRNFFGRIAKYLIFLGFLVFLFFGISGQREITRSCQQVFEGWFSSCMAEFDGDPKKVADLGLIEVTPAIELLIGAGVRLSRLPLSAGDKDSLRGYCVGSAYRAVEMFPSECKW